MAQNWLEQPIDLTGKRIYVAGHNGMVGRAVCAGLEQESVELITISRSDLDLCDQAATHEFIQTQKPDMVVLAAARVGGILPNSEEPADFLSDNLLIATNVIHAAHGAGVQRLLNLGSSCMYPKDAPQPLKPEHLLTGAFEPTNEAYALAKVTAMKLCEGCNKQYGRNYMTAIPCNLYGPHDHFDDYRSHVIPALMKKMTSAEDIIKLLGTGAPLREFSHVNDLAKALVMMLKSYDGTAPVNIGSGEEISIRDLASLIKDVTNFKGVIEWDENVPDGMARKVMESSIMREAGWAPEINLREGLQQTYEWLKEHV